MSNHGTHRGVRTIAVPWRRTRATLPAVALIGGSIALAAPASDAGGIPVSGTSPAIVVTGTANTMPPVATGAATSETPGHTPSAARSPAAGLAQEICNVSTLGVKTCALVLLS